MTDPTTDCPPCPACSMPTGIAEGYDCETLPSTLLRCAACGNLWDGTAEERAQAERADAAHEASIRAEERAGLWGAVRRRNAMETT